MKSVLAIIQSSPYADIKSQEHLEMVLSFAAFEQPVSLLFVGNGVLQLCKNQDTAQISKKQFTQAFAALSLYDIDNIYIASSTLNNFNLGINDLMVEAKVVNPTEIPEIIKQHDFVLTS